MKNITYSFTENEIKCIRDGLHVASIRLESFSSEDHSTGWAWVGAEGMHKTDRELDDESPIWSVNCNGVCGLALNLQQAMLFIESRE
jgi:hypothetical protein